MQVTLSTVEGSLSGLGLVLGRHPSGEQRHTPVAPLGQQRGEELQEPSSESKWEDGGVGDGLLLAKSAGWDMADGRRRHLAFYHP